MKTVKEVSKLTGISVRTLQYYDRIGLLPPAVRTQAGYRLYDDTALERLQQILLFRELAFSLSEIKEILGSPDFDRNKALRQQIELLELKKEHLENLILFARGIESLGVNHMDFTAFDKSKLEAYAKEAKKAWGHTPEYAESQEKAAQRTPAAQEKLAADMMRLFTEFGSMRGMQPDAPQVQRQVKRLQDFITENCYTCSKQVLAGLGKWYAGGGEVTENIDRAGGVGTAQLAAAAIALYCADADTDN
ncbi:MAG: MerR family transcriptional regulator [Oscillospiraceae bacterium]|nr:MerR family transcriptional regulator [Oscillospiraceae bacterium]